MESTLCRLWWTVCRCSRTQSFAGSSGLLATTIPQAVAFLHLAVPRCPLQSGRSSFKSRGFCYRYCYVYRCHNTDGLPQSGMLRFPPLSKSASSNVLASIFNGHLRPGRFVMFVVQFRNSCYVGCVFVLG